MLSLQAWTPWSAPALPLQPPSLWPAAIQSWSTTSISLQPRSLWSNAPPEPRSRIGNWPTVLYSWWATSLAATIILTRLSGRKVRSNVLFREDWIMLAALVPLFVRMAFIHVVLIYGTNNVATEGVQYTPEELRHRAVGARLVLAARIWYAVFIWMSKWTVSEFLKRITLHLWRTSYEYTLHCIRIFLLLTLIAVIIATLAECQPIDHYWQVTPDPGPQCRQGFAQLLTMGTADIITDILLVAFPIPIVLRSGQTWRRKLQLAALFSTSIALIVITGMRMPEVIRRNGRQQYRTVWASSEILASTFVSNFVIIGSFLRDKGTKKNKYKNNSVSDSIERASIRRQPPLQMHSLGSDEDLFRDLGCRIPDHLRDPSHHIARPARPAPKAFPASSSHSPSPDSNVGPSRSAQVEGRDSDESPGPHQHPLPSPSPSTVTKKNVSFFDVGGLLEDGPCSTSDSLSITRSRSTTLLSNGNSFSIATDFAPSTPEQSRRGSRAFLTDIGGILIPSSNRGEGSAPPFPPGAANGYTRRGSAQASSSRPRTGSAAPIGILGPMLERHETQFSLQDAGGLLAEEAQARQSEAAEIAQQISRPVRPSVSRSPTEISLNDVGGLLR